MKKNTLKIVISIIAAAVMLSAAVFSYAYFSYNHDWKKEHNINTGKFSAEIGVTGIIELEFKYPTIINLPKLTNDGTEIGGILYKRRGDDTNFDGAVISLSVEIENTGEIEVKLMPQTEFFFGETQISYIKHFVISEAEYANILAGGTIAGTGVTASYQNYIRYYAELSGELTERDFERDTDKELWQDAYDKMQDIAAENDRVLAAALKTSARHSKVQPGGIGQFRVFMWLDFAALEQHYKGGEIKTDYFSNNLLSYLQADLTGGSLPVSAQITIQAEQYNE